ncbi:hypothetical protein TEA_007453 [Camellia sinensis var. sinensis]|uniref:CRAL-TRIO domain-containing protein n=1 Tax=Camellia sinensis var. sinensis TaxID=542762 RepID=A0A4S4E170_CAMSN|nr:hypothetical protein TEA_007453 [Camellia sinensis var. sinensis]
MAPPPGEQNDGESIAGNASRSLLTPFFTKTYQFVDDSTVDDVNSTSIANKEAGEWWWEGDETGLMDGISGKQNFLWIDQNTEKIAFLVWPIAEDHVVPIILTSLADTSEINAARIETGASLNNQISFLTLSSSLSIEIAFGSHAKPPLMESSSPISIQQTLHQDPNPESSPKPLPYKKSFVTSLMEAATLRTPSFREDSYFVSHLKSSERKALQELKDKLMASHGPDSMWAISLLSNDDKSDVILLKFLRARDFRVTDSLQMLLKCLQWRKDFEADTILDEDLGFKELEGVVAYMHGFDREGHPVCYNAYGVFKDKDMYDRIFGDDEKLQKFLRWRVQVLERGIKLLHFKPGGINSIIQVTDLKDMPKRELRVASNHILSLFQDNYPEMVARKIFINVPWYFSVLYSMFSPFLTQRTKSKFVISKEGNAAETLYKFIRPEDVPVQYGGLSRPSDLQNGPPKPASEFTVKGGEKVNIQIEGIEAGATITWDIVVGGWDLDYSAEFVPIAEGSYTIAVEKSRKIAATEEAIHNTFTAREAGKMVFSVDNTASRKRKVAAYRYVVRKSTAILA